MSTPTKTIKTRLGQLLIDSGKISQEQLDVALKVQKTTWKKLGDILIDLNFISDDDLADAISKQLSIERVVLGSIYIDYNVVRLIPKEAANKYTLIPVYIKDNKLHVAMCDPLNVYALDDLKFFTRLEIIPLVSTSAEIEKAIEVYFSKQVSDRAIEDLKSEFRVDTAEASDDDISDVQNAPVVRLANSILVQAISLRASDVHVEPFADHVIVRYRIDGSLVESMRIPVNLYPAVSTRIKIVAGMNIAEKRVPQDGRIEMEVDKVSYDFRVSTLPTVFGEKIVIRVLDRSSFMFSRKMLGFTDENSALVDKMIGVTNGIVLLTGPTGCGKTTTLYALLRELNTPDQNLVTIEDPVEYMLDGINQVQVNSKAGLTFAAGLRSILRQDPNIIMIGEIRDEETAQIAVRASITGHLVLSTLHTNDAPTTVARLLDMGVEGYLVAESLSGIIAQRLVRRLCPFCKEKTQTGALEMNIMSLESPETIYEPKGCPKCNGTGYKGRVAIHEVMHINRHLRDAIQSGKGIEEIRDIARTNGMTTLYESCKRLVLEGNTSIGEMVKTVYASD